MQFPGVKYAKAPFAHHRLNLDDMDMNVGVIQVVGKGSKERIVPIGEYAHEFLSVARAVGSTLPVFTKH